MGVAPVLLCSDSGSGDPADEVLLASAMRLLARRTQLRALALSADPAISLRAHPGLPFAPLSALDTAVAGTALVVVIGDLRRPESLKRAATAFVHAKRRNVPVALLAVRLPPPARAAEFDLLPLLAQAESLSGCDAASARSLAGWCGRRVEAAAPLEMVLEIEPSGARPLGRVGVSARAWAVAGAALREALERISQSGETTGVVLGPGAVDSLPARFDRAKDSDWRAWLQLALACDVIVDVADSTLLHVAAAHGVRPVAFPVESDPPRLHPRIGLAHLALPPDADTARIVHVLETARGMSAAEVRARAAPLRNLAWRALGPLADATRSRPFERQALPAPARAFVDALDATAGETAGPTPASPSTAVTHAGGPDAHPRPAPRA
jgi:hypothetical protein